MLDFFRNELRVGDMVAFRITQRNAGSGLDRGTVVGFTLQKVKIEYISYNMPTETAIYPHNCVKFVPSPTIP